MYLFVNCRTVCRNARSKNDFTLQSLMKWQSFFTGRKCCIRSLIKYNINNQRWNETNAIIIECRRRHCRYRWKMSPLQKYLYGPFQRLRRTNEIDRLRKFSFLVQQTNSIRFRLLASFVMHTWFRRGDNAFISWLFFSLPRRARRTCHLKMWQFSRINFVSKTFREEIYWRAREVGIWLPNKLAQNSPNKVKGFDQVQRHHSAKIGIPKASNLTIEAHSASDKDTREKWQFHVEK